MLKQAMPRDKKKTALDKMRAFYESSYTKGTELQFVQALVRDEAKRLGLNCPIRLREDLVLHFRFTNPLVSAVIPKYVEEDTCIYDQVQQGFLKANATGVIKQFISVEEFLQLTSTLPDGFGETKFIVLRAAEAVAESEGTYLVEKALAEGCSL